jgi:hypothetical protein
MIASNGVETTFRSLYRALADFPVLWSIHPNLPYMKCRMVGRLLKINSRGCGRNWLWLNLLDLYSGISVEDLRKATRGCLLIQELHSDVCDAGGGHRREQSA